MIELKNLRKGSKAALGLMTMNFENELQESLFRELIVTGGCHET